MGIFSTQYAEARRKKTNLRTTSALIWHSRPNLKVLNMQMWETKSCSKNNFEISFLGNGESNPKS